MILPPGGEEVKEVKGGYQGNRRELLVDRSQAMTLEEEEMTKLRGL